MEQSTINFLMEQGILISPEVLNKDISEKLIKKIIDNKEIILDLETLKKYESDFLEKIPETSKNLEVVEENKKKDYSAQYKKKDVIVLKSYDKEPKKRTFQDFVSVFNLRFNNIANMLRQRKELSGVTTISRTIQKNSNEKISLIGMVLDKNITKNDNIVLQLEDPTGICTAIIRKESDDKEMFELAQDIVLDEVIGITGTKANNAIFVDQIILPDIPIGKEFKKQEKEEYMVMLGDTHFGSKHFMKEDFSKFIKWIQGKLGNDEQKKLASKIKYVILTGDIVEGVGIYPSQEEDLAIKDITEQYEDAAFWLKQIPSNITIIAQSGNHDAGRLSEPQEAPFKDMAKALWDMDNIVLVSNPAYVNINRTDDFSGFDLLLYHGGSLIYYADNIPSIRLSGGQKKSDEIMKFLLKRRHLAPTHKSTLYLPDAEQDYLLIDIVPDFFITGHIHRSTVNKYRGVTIINASCWTETTEDQIKRGLEPLPARIPIVNLKTRDVKIMNFLTKQSREKEEEVQKEVKKQAELKT